MPTVTELITSRTINYNTGVPVGVREFHVTDCAGEQEILSLFNGVDLPKKLDQWSTPSSPVSSYGLFSPEVNLVVFDFEIRRDPNQYAAWYVRIIYRELGEDAITRDLAPGDVGYITMRSSFEATFTDTWRQWATDDELDAIKEAVLYQSRPGVPFYRPGTQSSDIGGTKIDVSGYPTSVPHYKQKILLELVSDFRIFANSIRQYIGTRNDVRFLDVDPGFCVFVGAEAAIMSPGKWQHTYNFEVDYYMHLVQQPARTPHGDVILDGSNGQAQIVSWVQPFTRLTSFQSINPYFANL